MVRGSPDTPGGGREDRPVSAMVLASSVALRGPAASAFSPAEVACLPAEIACSPGDLPGLEEDEPTSPLGFAPRVPEVADGVAAGSSENAPDQEDGRPRDLSADRCPSSASPPCLACPLTPADRRDELSQETCPAGQSPHCQPASSRRARRRKTQLARRRAERRARRKAAHFAAQLAAQDVSCTAAADLLQIARPTLCSWREELQASEPLAEPEPRGRPCLEVDVATRNAVFQVLHHVTGPAIGLPALQALFADVPRCVLQDILVRYRRVWRRRYAQDGFQLTWHQAGRVWAMDFTQPRQPIDGVFLSLLSIRDLASHCQLAWCPVRGQTAADVLPVLQELFRLYGPPLVIKHDNGSAFLADVTQQALAEALVAQLFSPPRQPQYNGAVERGNGVLKTYTHQHAQNEGHPFRWTSEDVHHAQHLANTISRPWGAHGFSPAQAWQERPPLTPEERQVFLVALGIQRQRAAQELGLDLAADLSHADRTRLDRLALSATLQDLGYLTQKHIRRAPKKPRRLTGEKLARRVAQYRRQRSEQKSAKAEDPTPPQSPEPAPAEPKNSVPPLLAPARPSGTMLAVGGSHAAPQTTPQAIPSAHREWTFTSWLRRILTPLLPSQNSSEISR